MSVRTRFAPSPTGYLHVGGARTALFNYLFARKHGGTFVLRVEDTDEARNTQAARDAIFTGMNWLGLDWDEGEGKGGDYGPYNQSERTAIYDKWFEVLREKGRVYEEEGAWRFRFERKPITMNDLVCGEVTIDYRDESNTPDMVIRRSDGSYVFHFVNVVDDLEMKITHVIRGEDHLMNTPKHLQLFEALGAPAPKYGHVPLILNPDGSKMSKSDKGAAVGDTPAADDFPASAGYERQGFLPSAVVNFLALLGWSPKSEEEVFTLEELVDRFSLESVNRAPARFDHEKCAWINQQHLLKLSDKEFVSISVNYLNRFGFAAIPAKVIELAIGKVKLLSELPEYLKTADSNREIVYSDSGAIQKIKVNTLAVTHLPKIAIELKQMKAVSIPVDYLNNYAVAWSIPVGKLMFPVRYAATGETTGPDLNQFLSTTTPSLTGVQIWQFCDKFLPQEPSNEALK